MIIETIYQKLINSDIQQKQGEITFNFFDISIKVKDKSAVGTIFQEWFGSWLKENGFYYRTKTNTQEFPDFLLNPCSDEKDLLEVKLFDYNAGANFDVANFDTYTRSLINHAYRLDADYLIFAYTLEDGVFSIKKIWLKKIWEITGSMDGRPVRMQVKQDTFVNIRPVNWYSVSKKIKFKPFDDKWLFLEHLHKAILMNPKKVAWDKKQWLDNVKENYNF